MIITRKRLTKKMESVTDKKYGVLQQNAVSSKTSGDVLPQDTGSGQIVENEYTMLIGKRPKLYDLNKNFTNFEIEFHIQADAPDQSFYVHILPQDQLDKLDLSEIPMKLVQGKISGKISNTNNLYQNYFIILKNAVDEEDAKIVIRTRTQILPMIPPPPPTPPAVPGAENNGLGGNQDDPTSTSVEAYTGTSVLAKGYSYVMAHPPVFYGLIVVVLLVLLGAGYYFFYYRKHAKNRILPDDDGDDNDDDGGDNGDDGDNVHDGTRVNEYGDYELSSHYADNESVASSESGCPPDVSKYVQNLASGTAIISERPPL